MDAATIIAAIGALLVSILSWISTSRATARNERATAKTDEKNRQLEFNQRRDHFYQCISDLISRNIAAQQISSRYQIVTLKSAMLPLRGEQGEQNTALIASLKVQQEGVERGMKSWDKNIETFQFIYSNLTLETDAPEIERMIALVKVASDDLKKAYNGYSATLDILETANELTKDSLTQAEATTRQINIEMEANIRQINLDYEREIGKLSEQRGAA